MIVNNHKGTLRIDQWPIRVVEQFHTIGFQHAGKDGVVDVALAVGIDVAPFLVGP